MYKNSEIKVLKSIKFVGEVSINLSKDLLGTSSCNTLKSCY